MIAFQLLLVLFLSFLLLLVFIWCTISFNFSGTAVTKVKTITIPRFSSGCNYNNFKGLRHHRLLDFHGIIFHKGGFIWVFFTVYKLEDSLDALSFSPASVPMHTWTLPTLQERMLSQLQCAAQETGRCMGSREGHNDRLRWGAVPQAGGPGVHLPWLLYRIIRVFPFKK